MSMSNNGLSKLIEECGEVLQISGKLLAYPSGEHPDNAGNLFERLEYELADLSAAIDFVISARRLDGLSIEAMKQEKLAIFHKWHSDPNN